MATGWLTDAYKASRMNRPTMPPSMISPTYAGAAPAVTPQMPKPGTGTLAAGASAPAQTMAPAQTPTVAPTYASTRRIGPPPVGTAPVAPTPTPAPQPAPYVPPTSVPTTPGYMGPGPVSGSPWYGSPAGALQGIKNDITTNPAGWNQYGLFNSTGAGAAGMSWLQYILSDPYNNMTTDAGERQAMEQANLSYSGAAERAKQAAAQAGAGQSGVAAGHANAEALNRGAGMAKEARSWEESKINRGDQRLTGMGLPLLGDYIAAKNGSGPPNPGEDKTGQYLQSAALIASLFA